MKSGQVRTGQGWKYFKSQYFWNPRFFTEPNIFPNSKIFVTQIFWTKFLRAKNFSIKKDIEKKISDSTFFQTHNVLRPNVNYDAKKNQPKLISDATNALENGV